MLNRFTDRAQRAIHLAQEEAKRLNHAGIKSPNPFLWVLAFSVIANFSIQPVLAQSPELSQEEIQRFTEEMNALEKDAEAFLKNQSTTSTTSSESHHSHCEVIIPPQQFADQLAASISVIFRGLFGDVNVGGDSLRRVAGEPDGSRRSRTLRGSRPHSLWTFTPADDGFERVFYSALGLPVGRYPIEITGPLRGDPVTATVLLGSPQLGAGVLKLLGIHTLSAGQVQEVCTIVVGAVDTTAPGAVMDLSVSSPTTTSLTLNWTAPGDDGNTGAASSYDIRFRKDQAILTDADFESSSQATGEPSPLISGTKQTFVVSGLEPGTKYFFAIKTTDDAGNVSGISNSPEGRTCIEINVPLFTQDGAPWSGDMYNNTKFLISKKGCALASLAMVVKFFGVAVGANGLEVNPGNLNRWLNENGGYWRGDVDWKAVSKYTGGKVEWAGPEGPSLDALDADLSLDRPVILGLDIRGDVLLDHFVVAKGLCGDKIFINDPNKLKSAKTLADYSIAKSQVNAKTSPRRFKKASTDFSGLYIGVGADVLHAELVVVAPDGKRTGVVSGQDVKEIPRAHILRETISDDETGEDGPDNFIVDILKPAQGEYKIVINGLGDGVYEIGLRGQTSDAERPLIIDLSGLSSSGKTQEYVVAYSPVPGDPVGIRKIVTFASLTEEIKAARRLNLIKNQGIQTSLLSKLSSAQQAKDRNQPTTASNVLNALLKEISAQTNKGIDKTAAQIFTESIQALLGEMR